jgi:hypothetical protein
MMPISADPKKAMVGFGIQDDLNLKNDKTADQEMYLEPAVSETGIEDVNK